ncbi:hypothetical protein evm_012405 [Chilo suppressalis]|nr:hypothetical protein evm_012405 [Chilo suppressalis]
MVPAESVSPPSRQQRRHPSPAAPPAGPPGPPRAPRLPAGPAPTHSLPPPSPAGAGAAEAGAFHDTAEETSFEHGAPPAPKAADQQRPQRSNQRSTRHVARPLRATRLDP